jgi:hypothetical protein
VDLNVLSFEKSEENGLSFELVVDGEPLDDLVGGATGGIPYWIIEDDLTHISASKTEAGEEPNERIVCVCSCGEYGCGHTRCRILKVDRLVVFSSFASIVSTEGRNKTFCFTRKNYDDLIAQIVAAASAQEGETAQ